MPFLGRKRPFLALVGVSRVFLSLAPAAETGGISGGEDPRRYFECGWKGHRHIPVEVELTNGRWVGGALTVSASRADP